MADPTDKTEDEVNRLHDMLVHEVSLVDRAANNRTFLLLKRSEQMQTVGAEVVENEDGELTTVEATQVEDSSVSKVDAEYAIEAGAKARVQAFTTEALKRLTDVATAIKDMPDAPQGEGLPLALAKELADVHNLLLSFDAEHAQTKSDVGTPAFLDNVTKASALRMLTESMERLVAVVKAVQGAAAPAAGAEATALPELLTKELTSIASLLVGVIERHTEVADEQAKSDKSPAELRREGTLKAFSTSRVATDDRLAAIAKAASALPVKKAGAKMSSSRLDKLQSAARELLNILKDVAPEAFEELISKAGGSKPASTPEAVTKSAPVPDPRVAELEAEVASLKATNKKQASSLERLQKSYDLPNSMVVESTSSELTAVQEAPVSWPSDMNRPVSKDTIKKGHWFGRVE